MKAAPEYDGLYEILGYRFKKPSRVTEALTHPSLSGGVNYQRLEFLGDRVLGLVMAETVYARNPGSKEGILARQFTDLVRKEALAIVAQNLGLSPYVRLAKSEEDDGGREKSAILADVCEALIGALYIDGGFEVARAFIEKAWAPLLADGARGARDAKSQLQEWAQGLGRPTPSYRVIERMGPDHAPSFVVEVSVEGYEPVTGEGTSKRAAEMMAADLLFQQVSQSGRIARSKK